MQTSLNNHDNANMNRKIISMFQCVHCTKDKDNTIVLVCNQWIIRQDKLGRTICEVVWIVVVNLALQYKARQTLWLDPALVNPRQTLIQPCNISWKIFRSSPSLIPSMLTLIQPSDESKPILIQPKYKSGHSHLLYMQIACIAHRWQLWTYVLWRVIFVSSMWVLLKVQIFTHRVANFGSVTVGLHI